MTCATPSRAASTQGPEPTSYSTSSAAVACPSLLAAVTKEFWRSMVSVHDVRGATRWAAPSTTR